MCQSSGRVRVIFMRRGVYPIRYLSGEFDAARRELTIAERLGAPAWRVAFNRGLIDEAQGRGDQAMDYYRKALEENPEYEPARFRLRGLESERGL